MGHRVLARLANVVPALIVLGGIALVPAVPEWLDIVVRNVALASVPLTLAMGTGTLLNALNNTTVPPSPPAVTAPIKGSLHMVRIALSLFPPGPFIAPLSGKSPR